MNLEIPLIYLTHAEFTEEGNFLDFSLDTQTPKQILATIYTVNTI
jgi:hypothetical protein